VRSASSAEATAEALAASANVSTRPIAARNTGGDAASHRGSETQKQGNDSDDAVTSGGVCAAAVSPATGTAAVVACCWRRRSRFFNFFFTFLRSAPVNPSSI